MKMKECPKYSNCSVPICPLDEGNERHSSTWRDRAMCNGEPTCPFLLESMKEGAEERFEKYAPEMWEIANLPSIAGIRLQFSQVDYAMESAKNTGSKWDANEASGERLSAWRESQEEL